MNVFYQKGGICTRPPMDSKSTPHLIEDSSIDIYNYIYSAYGCIKYILQNYPQILPIHIDIVIIPKYEGPAYLKDNNDDDDDKDGNEEKETVPFFISNIKLRLELHGASYIEKEVTFDTLQEVMLEVIHKYIKRKTHQRIVIIIDRNEEEIIFESEFDDVGTKQKPHHDGDILYGYQPKEFVEKGENGVRNFSLGGQPLVASWDANYHTLGIFKRPNEDIVNNNIDVYGKGENGEQFERLNTVKAGLFWFVWQNFFPQTDVNPME